MSSTAFARLYASRSMQRAIAALAADRTRVIDVREDLTCAAWLAVAALPSGLTETEHLRAAERAINRVYLRTWRDRQRDQSL